MAEPSVIEVRDVCFAYPGGHGHRAGCSADAHRTPGEDEHGGRDLLHHVGFTVAAGERLGVTGPNGGGKSTLLKLLLGELRPTGGSISVTGGPPAAAVRRGRVGFVPQRDELTVGLPLTVRGLVDSGLAGAGLLSVPGKAEQAHVDALLERLHLKAAAAVPVGHLSGGMRRRALLARALAARPAVLLLDEPTAGLDEPGTADLLAALADEPAATVLVSHAPAVLVACDRGVRLDRTLTPLPRAA